MRVLLTALILCSVSLSSAASLAKDVKPAKPAAHKAQGHAAKPGLAQLAAQGDAQAQYQLGLALQQGKGMKADPVQAVGWLAMAAGNGVAEAAHALAVAHEKGVGVPIDAAQAAYWLYRAGTLGDEQAKSRFTQLLMDGEIENVAGPTGVSWLLPLAEAGNLAAQLTLGKIFDQGEGVVADRAKAKKWYEQAALGGNVDAMHHLGRMLLAQPAGWRLLYKDRSREKDNVDRDRLYSNRLEAEKAGGGDREPDIMRPGLIAALYWLGEAARQGHPDAAYLLGRAYLDGVDLPFSLPDAVENLNIAALEGHGHAALVLARLAQRGVGFIGPDPVRAWVSFDLAAGQSLGNAAQARDELAKSMSQRQLNKARQVAQDLRGN